MTKRLIIKPIATIVPAAALALIASIGLVACSPKTEHAAEGKNEEQHHEFSHISYADGDAARGEKLASEKIGGRQACVECHGKGGANPIDPTYPVLAGQYSDYIFHSIQAYRDGTREHALMSPHIKALVETGKFDDQAIADLAAYFSSQPSPLGDLSNH